MPRRWKQGKVSPSLTKKLLKSGKLGRRRMDGDEESSGHLSSSLQSSLGV